MNDNTNNKTSRRDFIKNIWKLAGIAAIAEFTFLGISMFKRENNNEHKSPSLFEAGNINKFKPDSITSFRANKFFLYRNSDYGFLAISVKCTHLGCAINWDDSKKQFICPCHSSHFDIAGNVLTSPATRPLDILKVTISNNIVFVDTSAPKRRTSFSKNQLTYA